MKFQVIYDNDTQFIVSIIKKLYDDVEFFNISYTKDKKKATPIMVRHGTRKVPLIVIKDEESKEIAAIWSEQNPNWEEKIQKYIK